MKYFFRKKQRPNMVARQQRLDKLDEEGLKNTPKNPLLRIWTNVFLAPFKPLNFLLAKTGLKYKLALQELGLIIIASAFILLPGLNYSAEEIDPEDFGIGIDDSHFSLDGDFVQKYDSFEEIQDPTAIIEYVIQEGDDLQEISRHFGITPQTILWTNNIPNPDILLPGRKIKILPVTGILYKVKRGDTVNKIANSYGIKEDFIVYQNQLDENLTLLVGEEVILPDAKPKATKRLPKTAYTISPDQAAKDGDGIFVYPTDGILTQYFHARHYAVDIANNKAPSIYAADEGKVVRVRYSGWNGGYGNYLVIEHNNGVQTLYAHMQKIYVKKNDIVGRGQAIGQMGNTGRSSGTHLHFEVIENGRKKNPLRYF